MDFNNSAIGMIHSLLFYLSTDLIQCVDFSCIPVRINSIFTKLPCVVICFAPVVCELFRTEDWK